MEAFHLRSVGEEDDEDNHPQVLLPGDDSLYSPFIRQVSELIVAGFGKPDLGPFLFRRDSVPVFPNEESLRLEGMQAEYFVSWGERYFHPYKLRYDSKGRPERVRRPMTKDVARVCLADFEFQRTLPSIERLYPLPVPVITTGNKMHLCAPGYDRTSKTFVFTPSMPRDPDLTNPQDGLPGSHGYYDDRMSLTEAVRILYDLHKQFPFADWSPPFIPAEDSTFHDPAKPDVPIRTSRSLAVQIMSMLAIFAAGCAPQGANRLGFLYNANKQRSGKSLLGKIATIPVFGTFKGQSWREGLEDMQKLLDSEVLAASPYICFDNIRSVIASEALEAFMTSSTWTGRVLGKSQMFTGENNAILLFTANNGHLGADMQQRLLICDLYIATADRQEREEDISDSDIIDEVWLARADNRRRILSALWAIVRHWDAAGRPPATGKPRRGFETWCRIFAGMVEFAGFGDALERPTDLDNCGDSESEDFEEFVRIASENHRKREMTFQEVVHILWENGLIPWCLHGREEYVESLGKPSLKLDPKWSSRLGLLLKRNCSGERGQTFTLKDPDNGSTRRVKIYQQGKGSKKRYITETNHSPNQ